jgi:hypothetical protein
VFYVIDSTKIALFYVINKTISGYFYFAGNTLSQDAWIYPNNRPKTNTTEIPQAPLRNERRCLSLPTRIFL